MTSTNDDAVVHVPVFEDVQAAAGFWDERSPLDFPERFKDVAIRGQR